MLFEIFHPKYMYNQTNVYNNSHLLRTCGIHYSNTVAYDDSVCACESKCDCLCEYRHRWPTDDRCVCVCVGVCRFDRRTFIHSHIIN